jgi:RNA polymerase sigma-70 factor (ECF subfamily)
VAVQTLESSSPVHVAEQGRQADDDLRSAVDVFMAQRPRLLAIANRIVRSTAEADDVVQEVWLRWQRTDRTLVQSPPGFLATTTSRVAINVLHAARTRHETAVGPLLADVSDATTHAAGDDPQAMAERADDVGLALHLLDRLSPSERAAYLLRHGFDYPYHRIAAVLHVSAVNARQLVSRAHVHLRTPRAQPSDVDAHRRLHDAFTVAARAGRLGELENVLAADVERRRPGGPHASRGRRTDAA